MNDGLVEKVEMLCPLCGKIHNVEKREKLAQTIIKDKVVDYYEIYFLCTNCSEDDECEFIPAKTMNQNLQNAREGRLIS